MILFEICTLCGSVKKKKKYHASKHRLDTLWDSVKTFVSKYLVVGYNPAVLERRQW